MDLRSDGEQIIQGMLEYLPQILVVVMVSISMVLKIILHVTKAETKTNAWYSALDMLLLFFLLWWGGFFK